MAARVTGLAMLASATARHTSAEQFVANVTRDLPKFIELDLVQQEIRKAEEERPVAVVIFDERGTEVGKVDLP